MKDPTQTVTVDRSAWPRRFGGWSRGRRLDAFALGVLHRCPSGGAEPDDRARARRLRFGCRWEGVANALHKHGYETATPELGLASVAEDVATVRSTLDSIPGDKILVGHSYGGFVITTDAASGRTDVRALVYTAAYVPESGETITTLGEGYILRVLDHLVFVAPPFPIAIVDPQFFPEDFAQDLNPKLGAEIAAQQRPTSLALFVTPSGPAACGTISRRGPSLGPRPRHFDPALQRFIAQRAGSTTVQFAAASHVGGLTHYKARLVNLIEQASDATAN